MWWKTKWARLNRSPAKRFGAQDWHRSHRSPLMNHPKEGRSGRITTPRGGMHPSWFANRVHSSLGRISAECQVSSLFRHSTSKAWFRPRTWANACWHNPNESHAPRKSGFHTTKIPQQIHQSIRANRHPMRFRLQNISKYFYLDGSSHTLTCSYNLGSKNEFDLAQLRSRHACMRGRSLLTPLGQPPI